MKIINRKNFIYNRVNLLENEKVVNDVKLICKRVKDEKDKALFEYAKKFDNTGLNKDNIRVSEKEIKEAYKKVDKALLSSLRKAKQNILSYHKKYVLKDKFDGTQNRGFVVRSVERAAIYVPGGTAAYPSTVLMGVCAAKAAGVKDIAVVTPYKNNAINPLTIVAAKECGASEILKIGGAHAIAALAYGTASVKKADVIAGPGNIYVTLAKKEVYGSAGIDMLAGPSEILIIADDSANPAFLAADLLSQAEHDVLASAILFTDNKTIAEKTLDELTKQAAKLSRKNIISESLKNNCYIVLFDKLEQAFEKSNEIAPEHLQICTKNAKENLKYVNNAGAVFLGNYSPEPVGDYFAGPNHILPTNGNAKFSQALSADFFVKKINVINYGEADFNAAAEHVVRLAECEGLDAHANSIKVRGEK